MANFIWQKNQQMWQVKLDRSSNFLLKWRDVVLCGTFVKLREWNMAGFIMLILYALLGNNKRVLGSPQVFDERIP